VAHDDQLKTTFWTKWGRDSYRKISFGLINAEETFQRTMHISFRRLLGECTMVYLDDVTIFLRDRKDHIARLRKVFNICIRYDISFNPKNMFFLLMKVDY